MRCPDGFMGMSGPEIRRMMARQEEGWRTFERIMEAARALGIL